MALSLQQHQRGVGARLTRTSRVDRPLIAPCRRDSYAFGGQVRARSSLVARAAEAGMAPELKARIDELISSNKVVVFIKGTKQFPQCGFSNTVVQILREVNAPFEAVNVLEADALRSGMKAYSAWPTFPQVYIGGEFFGGADIMIEAFQSGELQETLERVMNE